MPPSLPPAVHLQKLTKTYEMGGVTVEALRGITLEIQAGVTLAIQ